jgi:hypothetical protein
MTDASLRRIHDVTDNFFFRQGLRSIPVGGVLDHRELVRVLAPLG